MEPDRFKIMVTLSSDHAGIARQLGLLEREIYHVVARVEDARELRDYIAHVRLASMEWLENNPHAAPWDRKK